jgi:glycosyltransferase involved in cell wall biosynthesis
VFFVVTPAQNEAETIGAIVAGIVALGGTSIVVDDASTDETGALASAAGATVVRLDVSLGVGNALRTGFATARSMGADAVVQCDGDGQHPVEEIPHLLAYRPDAALVIGSRFLADRPLELSVGKRAGIALLRRRLWTKVGLRISDPTSGFRVIREPLLGAFAGDFPSSYLGDTFEACLAAAELVGPSLISETGVTMRDRQGGVPFAKGPHAAMLLIRALVSTSSVFRKPLEPLGRAQHG